MKLTENEFYQICVNQKIKVTPQRWVTYQALISMEGHPRVEDVYNKVIKKFPSITLNTVYKTLEWLEKNKFISSIFLRDPPKIYDTTTEKHHHLVCVKCGKIIDFGLKEKPDVVLPNEIKNKFNIQDYNLIVNIVCNKCTKEKTQ